MSYIRSCYKSGDYRTMEEAIKSLEKKQERHPEWDPWIQYNPRKADHNRPYSIQRNVTEAKLYRE